MNVQHINIKFFLENPETVKLAEYSASIQHLDPKTEIGRIADRCCRLSACPQRTRHHADRSRSGLQPG